MGAIRKGYVIRRRLYKAIAATSILAYKLGRRKPIPIAWAAMIMAGALIPQSDDALDLLRKVEERIASAKALRVKMLRRSADGSSLSRNVTLLADGRFLVRCMDSTSSEWVLRYDGRALVHIGTYEKRQLPRADAVSQVRRSILDGIMITRLIGTGAPSPRRNITWLGYDKLAGVEAAVLRYDFGWAPQAGGRSTTFTVKLWIDKERLVVLRTIVAWSGQSEEETMATCDYEAPIDDTVFRHESQVTLAAGRSRQVARSADLFVRYTGELPRSLRDLKQRPNWLRSEAFWPEGGFWIGDTLPEDVPFRVTDRGVTVGRDFVGPRTRRAISAPTMRLAKHYASRVRIALIGAAAEAFRITYLQLPTELQDLSKRPEWASVWPEAGFAPTAHEEIEWLRVPAGLNLRIPTVAGIAADELTRDERKMLTEAADVRLTQEEHSRLSDLLRKLRSDDMATRGSAFESVREFGAVAAGTLDRLIASEKDPELLTRLRALRSEIGAMMPSWRRELGAAAVLVPLLECAGRDPELDPQVTEDLTAARLKRIKVAQDALWHGDGNRFWVRDVAGLCFRLVDDKPLTSVPAAIAYADASPRRGDYRDHSSNAGAVPDAGYYYSVIEHYETEDGNIVPYEERHGSNATRFAVSAYPVDPPFSGRFTFIISERGNVWSKDTDGCAPAVFPRDPALNGWRKVR